MTVEFKESSGSIESQELNDSRPDPLICAIDEVELQHTLVPPITNVIDCLKLSSLGLSVSSFFKTQKYLDDTYRGFLIEAIVDYEMRCTEHL